MLYWDISNSFKYYCFNSCILYRDEVIIIYFNWYFCIHIYRGFEIFEWNILLVIFMLRCLILFSNIMIFFINWCFKRLSWFQKSNSHIFFTSNNNYVLNFFWNVRFLFELEYFLFNISWRFDYWDVCSTCNYNTFCLFVLWRNIISLLYFLFFFSWLGITLFLVFNRNWTVRNFFCRNKSSTFFLQLFFLTDSRFTFIYFLSFKWLLLFWIGLNYSFSFFFNLSLKWIFNRDRLTFIPIC